MATEEEVRALMKQFEEGGDDDSVDYDDGDDSAENTPTPRRMNEKARTYIWSDPFPCKGLGVGFFPRLNMIGSLNAVKFWVFVGAVVLITAIITLPMIIGGALPFSGKPGVLALIWVAVMVPIMFTTGVFVGGWVFRERIKPIWAALVRGQNAKALQGLMCQNSSICGRDAPLCR
jgi:hypothetical protein